MTKINVSGKLGQVRAHGRPKIVAGPNGQEVKVVKLQGAFVGRHHKREDGLLLVWRGRLRVEFRDRVVELAEGELLVAPHGVEHRTVADEEAGVILFEPAATRNTGNVTNEAFTAPMGETI